MATIAKPATCQLPEGIIAFAQLTQVVVTQLVGAVMQVGVAIATVPQVAVIAPAAVQVSAAVPLRIPASLQWSCPVY